MFLLCCLTWGQSMVEVMQIMAIFFKRSHACSSACPEPCSRPPETPGHWQASLGQSLVGSLPFSPGSWRTQGLFISFKSLLSLYCVSSGSSVVELMVTSSKRAFAIPRSTAPRAPAPAAVHCWPVPLQQTLRHSSVSVSAGSLGPGVHKACLSPLSISGRYGVWF